MTFNADYPGAIVVEAANYGYGVPNQPKTWGFHTPEEDADSTPVTPGYLANTDRDASYTYFVSSWLALSFQLVPESEGAYAHGLEGKPEPAWSDGTNLNLQSFSLSFEGRTATIRQTMPRGCPQWTAAVNLVAHRTKALGLNLDIAFQHKDVSIHRGDCGAWDQAAFIADVKAKMQEEGDMALTLQQIEDRAAMHDQWHRETLDPWMTNRTDRITMLEGEVEGLKARAAALEAGHLRQHERIKTLEDAPAGGGLKRGDTVKLT